MAYSIWKEITIAAGHHIPGHPGKCRHLHGHNYRVRVELAAERLDELGMVVDFSVIKQALAEVVGVYDHRVINDIPPFDELNPTAELLSEHVCRGLQERLDDERVRVAGVEVWENQTSCAIFRP